MTDTTRRIEVPPFFCPLPSALHPHAAEVEKRSIAWLEEIGLITDERSRRRLTGTRSADFFARFTPHATVMAAVQAATDWVYWGFAFDDLRCDQAGTREQPDRFVLLVARLLRMLDGLNERLCGQDVLLRALLDIAVRYSACATDVQMRRWVLAIRQWLFGVVQRNSQRTVYGVPGIDEYVAMRLHDCGGTPVAAPMEVADGVQIPGAELDSPGVGLADAIRQEKRCSQQQAAMSAIAIRDRVMCLFLRLGDQLRESASAPLRAYIDDLSYGVRGNIEWSLNVPRYTSIPSAECGGGSVRITFSSSWAPGATPNPSR